MDINITSQIVVQTAAQWAADVTVYSAKRILVTSDVLYTGIDQRKFKLANGTDAWSALDYVPVGELLNGITIDWSRDSGGYLQSWFYAHTSTLQIGYGNQYLAFTNSGIKPFGVSAGVSKLMRYNASGILVASTLDEGDIATTAYADSLVVGLWDDRGNFDASVNAYPSSGGSGTAGAILKGDIWTVSVAGTLPTGLVVAAGDTVRALIDTPGNTQANWAIAENNIGYVPLNAASNLSDLANAATARINLGATTVGSNIFTLTNPGAISFLRINADNTVTARTPAQVIADLGSVWVFHKDASLGTATSGTSNTISKSRLIPGGTVVVGTTIRVNFFAERVGTTGTGTNRLYVNNTNDLTTPDLVGTMTSATNLFFGGSRTLSVRSATETVCAPPTANLNDDEAGQLPNAPVLLNIDWTIDQYIITSCQCSNALDSMFNNYFEIDIK